MSSIPFFQVDAFAQRPLTGNPAAVMPLDRWLDDELLQAIASENNLSETAFTVPSDKDDADYHLRWFTPSTEVPLCGHATLASGHILLRGDRVRFSTRSGVLTVSRKDELLELNLPAASLIEADEPGLCDALGITSRRVWIATEGHDAVIVPLDSEQDVRSVRPNFAALRDIPKMAVVTAPGADRDIVSRVFVSYVGIDEDPVTGSAHSALVPFWAERLGRERFSALQASRRSGTLDCGLDGNRVILGGRCFTVVEGYFQL